MRGIGAGAAILMLAGCTTPGPVESGGTVTVFAAASLTGAFDEIAGDFEAANPGVDVVLNFGGSASLANQIAEGAPADVFASAAGASAAGADGEIFATNVLEIAVPVGNPGAVAGIEDFANPDLTLAICAVEVPCGAAAQHVFDAAGMTAAPDTLEQDVKAVLTKVVLGEVDAGLVYRTDVLAARADVDGIDFPEAAAAVNRYPIVAFTEPGAAFADWVLSDAGQAVLARAGFGAP